MKFNITFIKVETNTKHIRAVEGNDKDHAINVFKGLCLKHNMKVSGVYAVPFIHAPPVCAVDDCSELSTHKAPKADWMCGRCYREHEKNKKA